MTGRPNKRPFTPYRRIDPPPHFEDMPINELSEDAVARFIEQLRKPGMTFKPTHIIKGRP